MPVWLVIGGILVIGAFVSATQKPKASDSPAPVAPGAPAAPPPPVESAAASDARFEKCRDKLKQAQQLDLLSNMTFEGGRPKIWVGKTWHTLPIDAKTAFAETAACFFLAGSSEKALSFPIYDGMTGKQIATWKYTRLDVE